MPKLKAKMGKTIELRRSSRIAARNLHKAESGEPSSHHAPVRSLYARISDSPGVLNPQKTSDGAQAGPSHQQPVATQLNGTIW